MESGSMLAEWALDRHPRKTGLRIAEFAECPLEPYEELLYCLRNMDEVELRRAQQKYSVQCFYHCIIIHLMYIKLYF